MNRTVNDRLYLIERQLERYRIAPTGGTGGGGTGDPPKNYATLVVKPFDSNAPDTADVILTGTDDHLAINDIIAPFHRIEFLDGHIRLGASIDLCDNLCIEGQGTEITIFEFNAATSAGFYIFRNVDLAEDIISDLELRRFTINCGDIENGGGAYFHQPGSNYNSRVLIEDVDFTNIDSDSIYFECTLGMWIHRCRFEGGGGRALYVAIGNEIRILECHFYSDKILFFESCNDCNIADSLFETYGQTTIENARTSVISNNLFTSQAVSPQILRIENGYRTVVSGNVFEESKLFLRNTWGATVSGNAMSNFDEDYGLEVWNAEYVLVVGNNIRVTSSTIDALEAPVYLYANTGLWFAGNKVYAEFSNDRRAYAVILEDCTSCAICFNTFQDSYETGKVNVIGGSGSVIKFNLPFDDTDIYTDEQARDAICAMFAAGTHTGITFTCDDGANSISAALSGTVEHNHTAANDGGILTNDIHDGFSEYGAISIPSVPAEGKMRFYARTTSGITKAFVRFDNGAEIEVGSGGGGGGAIPAHYDFQPEFANAIVVPAMLDNGTLQAHDDATARINAYRWTSPSAADQTVDIVLRWRLSPRFTAWSSDLQVMSKVSVLASTCALEVVEFLDTAGVNVITPASVRTDTWSTTAFALSAGTFTPSGILTLRFRLHAANDEYAFLGPVSLAFNEG